MSGQRQRQDLAQKLHTGPSPVTEGGDQAVVRIIITLADHCRPLLVVTGETAVCVIMAQTQAGHYSAPRLAAAYIKAGPNQGPGTRQRGRAVHRRQSWAQTVGAAE